MPPKGYRKAACAKGHPFTPENTRVQGSGRVCRTCVRQRKAQEYAQHYQGGTGLRVKRDKTQETSA